MPTYSHAFYDQLHKGALASAREVVPLLLEMIRPASVVDVGCGQGEWLSVFREAGVTDVVGLDGDYVDRSRLCIPDSLFLSRDLRREVSLDRRFDLVLSLEVAEHLPPAAADTFVRSLVALGPVVVFSAAIPFQPGVGHLNEQWPGFWAGRFAAHGYVPVDCLRRRVWTNDAVECWYAQNLLLYVKESALAAYPTLARHRQCGGDVLPLVHPKFYLAASDVKRASLRRLLAAIPHVLRREVRTWLRGTRP